MCLGERTKKRFKYEKQVLDGVTYNVGYKVFTFREGKLCGEWKGIKTVRQTNKWLHEKDFRLSKEENRIFQNNAEHYPSGWHIYVDKPYIDVLSANFGQTYRKVLFKTPVAKGTEYGKQVIVAKWIYILS